MTDARETMHSGERAAADGPVRLCAVSRSQKAPEDLIRFVLGPDGTIVPDLARRLPGRGVWVEATHAAVATAARRNVFARSLKRQVSVPADLAAQVERLMTRRLAEALSLAKKAGLAVSGFAKVEELMERGRAAVLLHAADAAADGAAKLDRKFKALMGEEAAKQAIVRELTGAEMSLAMGLANVVHAASSQGGASKRIVQEAERLRRYRSGPA
ncbi:MAG TPA: RNA-binding protein [Hyphomicrobiaceae bacterium]|nr:RNA-binding protein [Hyphomicrobiaceae bacterium]